MKQSLIKVRCKRTDRIVWVSADTIGKGGQTWGQVSETNESGWYFFCDELEIVK